MINIKSVNSYCKDPISLIENYEVAVNSTETYDCHHRLEIDLNLSRKELKGRDLYLNRPASELIFLTHSEHLRLHKTGERNYNYGKSPKDRMSSDVYEQWCKKQSDLHKGEKNPLYGVSPKDRMTPYVYEQWCKNLSDSHKGEKSYRYGKPSTTRGRHRVYHEDGTWHMEK